MKTINKVAEITLLFWIMKIIATTLGETLGDYLAQTLNLGYAVSLGITSLFFILVLFLQILQQKFISPIYWLVIIATTTLGTEISDFLDRSLHLGYSAGSAILLAGLLTTLGLWKAAFKNINVYPLHGASRELLYWTAILFSNSLGTAFGDFLSDIIGLSYLTAAIITATIILFIMLLHYTTKINTVLLFWIAFVFTRPFGAAFGDFLTKAVSKGGLAIETGTASIICLLLMSTFVLISQQKNSKVSQ